MPMLFRHLLSILLLPFLVVVLVPRALLRGAARPLSQGGDVVWLWPRVGAGVVLFVMGFAFFAWCVSLFVRVGRGTLAPWDPTRSLVAVGPYRYVRNPMITGVVLMLMGEALVWGSKALGLWAACFLVMNHLYFLLSEEPGLERRFGESYRTYKANVPRWIPRLRRWTGGPGSACR